MASVFASHSTAYKSVKTQTRLDISLAHLNYSNAWVFDICWHLVDTTMAELL